MPQYKRSKNFPEWYLGCFYTYKLISKNNEFNEVYYGYSCESPNVRLNKHKYDHKTKRKKLSSSILFDLGEVKIEVIKIFDCNQDARKHEGQLINNNDCVNILNSFETTEMGRLYNNSYRLNEKVRESKMKYINNPENREKILETKKKSYLKQSTTIIKCACGEKVKASIMSKHRKSKFHLNTMNNYELNHKEKFKNILNLINNNINKEIFYI